MTTLLLRLAGPLQAWGASSRFTHRQTERAPTKAGVLGLVAAAQGRRRTDPVTDLAKLAFGVRVDQPGRIERDFQTAVTTSGEAMPLTHRYYLADAAFLAGIEGDKGLLEGISSAIRSPEFPLYLGRRSCPPLGPLVVGMVDAPLGAALRESPWAASEWWRAKASTEVSLELLLDEAACPEIPDGERFTQRDVPVSFDPERREYAWRTVVRTTCTVSNPDGRASAHDPFAALGG